jgi:ribonuclease P protein component
VGLAVGGKIGSAVARNRAKRLLREAVRVHLADLPPGQDIVLIARKEIVGARLDDVSAALDTVLRRAGLLHGTEAGRSDGEPRP